MSPFVQRKIREREKEKGHYKKGKIVCDNIWDKGNKSAHCEYWQLIFQKIVFSQDFFFNF